MTTIIPFLLTIRDNPREWGPKLILADWFEERGDDRARLIRWWYNAQPALKSAFDSGRKKQLSPTLEATLRANSALHQEIDDLVHYLEFNYLRRLLWVGLIRTISNFWPTDWEYVQDWPEGWSAARVRTETEEMLCRAELSGLRVPKSDIFCNEMCLPFSTDDDAVKALDSGSFRSPCSAWLAAYFAMTSGFADTRSLPFALSAYSSSAKRGLRLATKKEAFAGSISLIQSSIWRSWSP